MPKFWLTRVLTQKRTPTPNPMTEKEKAASALYYADLGRHMGIRDLPRTWQEYAAHMDAYEAKHFAWDPRSRAVADAKRSTNACSLIQCAFSPCG